MNGGFEQKKARLLDALIERGGFQKLMDTAEEVFENPVFFGDVSLNILCRSGAEHDDEFWNYLCAVGYADENIMKEGSHGGEFRELYSSDAPRRNLFSFSKHPFLSARIRDGSRVMGHACVYGLNRDFTDEDEKLIVVLCKVLAYEMLYRGISSAGSVKYYSLLSDLLGGERLTEKDLKARAANARCRFPEHMRLAVLRNTAGNDQSLYFLREHLATELADSLVIVYEKSIVAICSAESERWEHNSAVLTHVLSGGEYVCGASRVYENAMETAEAYRQAIDTLNCTPNLSAFRINTYDESFVYCLLASVKDRSRLAAMADPALSKLARYDAENNTSLYETLRVYLQCGRNINAAAEALCIHKNSMYYRRDSIERLLGLSLDDETVCFGLELSYRIAEFCGE